MSDADIAQTLIVGAIVCITLVVLRRDLTLVAFDPGHAHAIGLRPRILHAVLLGDLVGDVLGPGLVEVQYGDVPARGGEGVGGGAADAALRARAGDDCGLHGCS